MSMMTMVMRAMTAIGLIVARFTALVGGLAAGKGLAACRATVRTGAERSSSPSLVVASAGYRRRGLRTVATSHSMGLIRPQYLPALARARSLRLRVAHLPVAVRPRH